MRGGPVWTLFDDGFPGAFDDLKCIFIHIPKAAGSSVALSLFGHQTGHRRYVDYWRENRRKTKDYFKFTFVRNPWDRLVSAYHFLRDGGMDLQDRAWADQNLKSFSSFEDFVKGWVNEGNVRQKNHFQPQHTYLKGYGSSDIKVDFVGRVENFERDFRNVCERLSIRREPMRANQSRHQDYRDYYTQETADIVRRVYERDVVLFGYDFDAATSCAAIDKRDGNERINPKDTKDERQAA